MDDNQTQATSAHRSINKYVSGCEKKRDSSFLTFGISPSKLISDMAFAGIRFFPGAAAHHKKNRPVNTRAGTDEILIAHLALSVTQRTETGLKKARGGEKKESSCHHGHIDPSISFPKIVDSVIRLEVFLAFFPQYRPVFLIANLKILF